MSNVVDLANLIVQKRAARNALLKRQIENLSQRRFAMYTHMGFSYRVAHGFSTRYYNNLVREIQSHDNLNGTLNNHAE